MPLQRDYCRAVASELDRHAVWEPGSPLRLGDYGSLDDGAFLRQGNIIDFELGEDLQVARSSPSTYEFTSAGTTVHLLDVQAQGNVSEQLGSAAAELRVKFAHAHSIYLRAAQTQLQEITNLRTVSQSLRLHDTWNYGWTIVSGLRTANNFSLILSATDNAEVSVRGTADALRALNAGSAIGQTGLSIAGEAALKVIGASGPVFIDLVRLRRILGGTKRAAQAGALAVKPYEVVAPSSVFNESPSTAM